MRLPSWKQGALALIAGAALLAAPTSAPAAVVSVAIGPPPAQPGIVDRQWARPYRTAVWIAPHYEVVNGRWVWVRGYYTYPPRPGMRWIPGRYRHGYWRPGHWGW